MKVKKQLVICISLLILGSALIGQAATGSPATIPGKSTWPSKDIPSVIPEYKGKVANYGNGGDPTWFQIYMVETSPKNVQDYIAQYQKSGWSISKEDNSDVATKDQYVVIVHFYKEQSLVGITISIKSTDRLWPVKEYPFVPQFSKCLSSSYREYEYNVTIDIKKASDADINEYKKNLLKIGWEGEPEGDEFYWRQNGLDIAMQISDQGNGNWFFDISK